MSMTDVPTSADIAAVIAEAEGEVRTIDLRGHTFTFRSPVPMGALAVFAARVKDSADPMAQAAAVPRFLKAWIVPEDHDDIEAMMEQVIDLDAFIRTDVTRFVEAAVARPTSAPSS